MKKRYSLLAVFMSFVMSLLVVEPVRATTSTDLQEKQNKLEAEQKELKEQKKQLENQRKSSQKSLDSTNSQIGSISQAQGQTKAAMDETNEEIVAVMADIELIEENITKKEEDIKVQQAAYDEAKEKEDTLYAAMVQRVKYMYEMGEHSYVQILLTAASYADALNKAQYVEQLYEYDRNKLEEYIEAKETAEALKNKLEEEKAELETSKHEREEEKDHLEELLSDYKAKYSDYEVKLAKAKQDAAVFTAQIKSQQSGIASLQKQIESKQDEVNKLKEEAARQAREAQEAAEAAKNSGGSGGGSGGLGGSSGGSKSYSSGGSASGSNVAKFACQFVGNPYVSGGISLTDGCDCSGFVFSVYKEFGISLPRTSWEQGAYGTEVSYSEAQPGDVIYYGGHVGIYIGGGQIVHASTQKTGIKYSSAMYRPIITVRRYL
ncbi:MAG: C40 family peptidase [Butyrivibrio sp.]|nr:C40 family peptidase [Butyrivibrio sp.]